jgi:hypothetical protein
VDDFVFLWANHGVLSNRVSRFQECMITFDSGASLSAEDQESIDFIKNKSSSPAKTESLPKEPAPTDPTPVVVEAKENAASPANIEATPTEPKPAVPSPVEVEL